MANSQSDWLSRGHLLITVVRLSPPTIFMSSARWLMLGASPLLPPSSRIFKSVYKKICYQLKSRSVSSQEPAHWPNASIHGSGADQKHRGLWERDWKSLSHVSVHDTAQEPQQKNYILNTKVYIISPWKMKSDFTWNLLHECAQLVVHRHQSARYMTKMTTQPIRARVVWPKSCQSCS